MYIKSDSLIVYSYLGLSHLLHRYSNCPTNIFCNISQLIGIIFLYYYNKLELVPVFFAQYVAVNQNLHQKKRIKCFNVLRESIFPNSRNLQIAPVFLEKKITSYKLVFYLLYLKHLNVVFMIKITKTLRIYYQGYRKVYNS